MTSPRGELKQCANKGAIRRICCVTLAKECTKASFLRTLHLCDVRVRTHHRGMCADDTTAVNSKWLETKIVRAHGIKTTDVKFKPNPFCDVNQC